MPYRLVIFDFDGTLADSGPWFFRTINALAERHRFRTVEPAEIEALRGCDTRAIMRFLGVPRWKLPLIARDMRRRMAADRDAIPLFEFAPSVLRSLAAAGIRIAIVTSNSEANVRAILGTELAGLVGWYACGASAFGKADKFRRVIRRAGVPRNAVLAIGDEVRDIEAARRVGIDAGAVAWGYATPDFLASRRPDLFFTSPGEIAQRLAADGAAPTERARIAALCARDQAG